MTPPSKTDLRRRMRARRVTVDPAVARDAAERAAKHLLALPRVQAAQTVALYAAMRSELSCAPADRALRARGVTVAYPRVVRDERRLAFHHVDDPATLAVATFGIREPDPLAPLVAAADLDVIVVPGLAFDTHGGRIGWGHGYYDDTLAATPDALHVGYAYELQLVEIVPITDRDAGMDCVITEAGARMCDRAAPSR